MTSSNNYCISLADVQAAAKRIEGIAHRTPVLTCQSINMLTGRRNVYFKVEALQRTGSFKFRGAVNAIQHILEQQDTHTSRTTQSLHVLTHSSGNHAQALAKAAQVLSAHNNNNSTSIQATIVMPDTTPAVKMQAVQDFRASIVVVPNDPLTREQTCNDLLAKHPSAVFVHPSEDPRVIAGQGTIALELLEQVPDNQNNIHVVIIPVGGGGLAAGNTIALRNMLGTRVKIVLAEPASMDDAKRSFYSQTLCLHAPNNPLDSVADGLKTTLGPNTFPIVRDLVDQVLTVSEYEILKATKMVWERLKVAIEPSAGVGVAVLLSDEFREQYPVQDYPNVAVILCGGNVDIVQMAKKMQEMGI
jgi:threonine dehydratase